MTVLALPAPLLPLPKFSFRTTRPKVLAPSSIAPDTTKVAFLRAPMRLRSAPRVTSPAQVFVPLTDWRPPMKAPVPEMRPLPLVVILFPLMVIPPTIANCAPEVTVTALVLPKAEELVTFSSPPLTEVAPL